MHGEAEAAVAFVKRGHLVVAVDERLQVSAQFNEAHALRSRYSKIVQRGVDDERLEKDEEWARSVAGGSNGGGGGGAGGSNGGGGGGAGGSNGGGGGGAGGSNGGGGVWREGARYMALRENCIDTGQTLMEV
jgi:hypothetical protein